MEKINDGGPAFPVDGFPGESNYTLPEPGMTLRQWYAGKALNGLQVRRWTDEDGNIPENIFEIWAKSAFKMADAMIAHEAKEREATKK